MINKKDVIRINQEVGENGEFSNESSLDFVFSIAKAEKSWLYELSYFVRNILTDHVFMDGNKRTAFILIITYFEDKGLGYDKDIIYKLVYKISKKNINNINKVMGMIKNAIKD